MSAILSFKAVAPIFVLIALGFLLRKLKLIDEDNLNKMSALAFKVFLPVLVFEKLYNAHISEVINIPIIIYTVFFLVSSFLLSLIIVPRIERDNTKRSVLVTCFFRGYTLTFGYPIITALYGENSLALLSMVLAVALPIRNAEGVIALELYGGVKKKFCEVVLNIIKNPLLIGAVLGIGAILLDLKLPYIFEKPIQDVSKLAAPYALILLGGFISFGRVKQNMKQIILGLSIKLIIIPFIFMSIAIILGFRDLELATILMLCAVPIGSSTFIMAQQMGADKDFAAQVVIVGTLVSSVTIFMWVFVLMELNFM